MIDRIDRWLEGLALAALFLLVVMLLAAIVGVALLFCAVGGICA